MMKHIVRPLSLILLFYAELAESFQVTVDARRQKRPAVVIQASSLSEAVTAVVKDGTSRDWINDNVLVLKQKESSDSIFRKLVPMLGGAGCDVTVEWKDPKEGAEDLATTCFRTKNVAAIESLTESLSQYRDIVREEGSDGIVFKARIVATKGQAGTKCPRFHFDHINLRWIQSLVGPGCDYSVSERGISRCCINGAEDCETDAVNDHLVDRAVADIRRARTGEAVVLKGAAGSTKPAVHKSPSLSMWEGRVLLTLDVLH